MDNNLEPLKLKLLEARLSDLEKGKLFAFCQDKAMLHAVEKALLYQLYMMGTVVEGDKELHDANWAFIPRNTNTTNELIGAEIRAKSDALSFLEDAIRLVKKFGEEKVVPTEEINPATGGKLKIN